MGTLLSFFVCFRPVFDFWWFKHFNSLVLKQAPLAVYGPLWRCAPAPAAFSLDTRVHWQGKNWMVQIRYPQRTISTSEDKITINSLGISFQPVKWCLDFFIWYLNDRNSNILHVSSVGQVTNSFIVNYLIAQKHPLHIHEKYKEKWLKCTGIEKSQRKPLDSYNKTYQYW